MLVGPEASGKSTILCKVNLRDVVPTVPTVGFKVESVEYKDFRFTVWEHRATMDDNKAHQIWRRNYAGTNGIVFVVDSSNADALAKARVDLHSMMLEEELAEAAVLVVANKQDLPNAQSAEEVCDKLGLEDLPGNQRWFLQPASAVHGDGLYEGLDWLAQEIRLIQEESSQIRGCANSNLSRSW